MARLVPVFLLALSLLLAISRATEDAVLDTDGNPVQLGVQYRVLPAIRGSAGGLYINRENGVCPANVVQHHRETNNGQPVIFFSEDQPTDYTLRVNTLLYIMTPRPIHCSDSTLWKVNDEGKVTTGGITAAGADPHYSRFTVTKGKGYGYVIQSSPCKRCLLPRTNVVVKSENGRRLLSVSLLSDAFRVVFVRAEKSSSNDDILLPATARAEN